jgi:hypothetical protein
LPFVWDVWRFPSRMGEPMVRMHRPLQMLKQVLLLLLGSVVLGAVAYLQIFWG